MRRLSQAIMSSWFSIHDSSLPSVRLCQSSSVSFSLPKALTMSSMVDDWYLVRNGMSLSISKTHFSMAMRVSIFLLFTWSRLEAEWPK